MRQNDRNVSAKKKNRLQRTWWLTTLIFWEALRETSRLLSSFLPSKPWRRRKEAWWGRRRRQMAASPPNALGPGWRIARRNIWSNFEETTNESADEYLNINAEGSGDRRFGFTWKRLLDFDKQRDDISKFYKKCFLSFVEVCTVHQGQWRN